MFPSKKKWIENGFQSLWTGFSPANKADNLIEVAGDGSNILQFVTIIRHTGGLIYITIESDSLTDGSKIRISLNRKLLTTGIVKKADSFYAFKSFDKRKLLKAMTEFNNEEAVMLTVETVDK